MAQLPIMENEDGIRKNTQVSFQGYNHNAYAGDGAIWDMENMTGDEAPLLAPRSPRYRMKELNQPGGFYARDGMFWIDGGCLYEKNAGLIAENLEDGGKVFATLGKYVVILPDKRYCLPKETEPQGTVVWETGTLYNSYNDELSGDKMAVFYKDNPIEGETTQYCVMELPWEDHGFRAGDGVTIRVFSDMQTYEHITVEAIIRNVDGAFLEFYENTFINILGNLDTVTLVTSIMRLVPDMDFICEQDNRLWGCKGDTIYASKLGDPFNWNVFDGLSTDSYAVDVGSAGDFTACCSYMGYPIFFKENQIYKMYGNKPSNYQVLNSASLGVQAGSYNSLAVAGEKLFYLSRGGIMCYSGGTPENLSAAFGEDRYHQGVGGSDGVKYYISMLSETDNANLFVYDTRTAMWHREDNTQVMSFGFCQGLYFLDALGKIWLAGGAGITPDPVFNWSEEGLVHSMVEFADFYEGGPNHAGTAKLQLRLEAEAGSTVEISLQFDSDGLWRPAAALTPREKRSYYLPIIPRRSDHFRLRVQADGPWRLYSLTREYYQGSEAAATAT